MQTNIYKHSDTCFDICTYAKSYVSAAKLDEFNPAPGKHFYTQPRKWMFLSLCLNFSAVLPASGQGSEKGSATQKRLCVGHALNLQA